VCVCVFLFVRAKSVKFFFFARVSFWAFGLLAVWPISLSLSPFFFCLVFCFCVPHCAQKRARTLKQTRDGERERERDGERETEGERRRERDGERERERDLKRKFKEREVSRARSKKKI